MGYSCNIVDVNDKAKVELRAAEPIYEQGQHFARLLDLAADGLIKVMFGPGYEKIVAKSFAEVGHDYSHEHVTFAYIDGEIAAAISFFSYEDKANASDKAISDAAGWQALRLAVTSFWARDLLDYINTLEVGDGYVQGLGVYPQHQGKGIGTLLLAHAEDLARKRNLTQLCLDVAETNSGARKLYERTGLKQISTSPKIPLLKNSRVHRLSRPL